MAQAAVREKVRPKEKEKAAPAPNTVNLKEKQRPAAIQQPAVKKPASKKTKPAARPVSHDVPRHAERPASPAGRHPHEEAARARLHKHEADTRWQGELAEMRATHDLDEVDDDVEQTATLFEWQAPEHTHRPKSPLWFAGLAAATTVVIGLQLFFFMNFVGALTLAFMGGLVYYIAQQPPATIRYRLLVDGIALNNTLYHYDDLDAFNVLYKPGETKTVLLQGKRTFSPLIHMEIGEADPQLIRDILVEFLPEDQEMSEPVADIVARRLGF